MRAVIYARYSSDNQREASIEDQLRICKERIKREGWTLSATYTDAAMSGSSRHRPEYLKLLKDSSAGQFEVVVAEALDRLSRDQEDVAGLHKQLNYAGVRLITLSEGEITELHVGLKGTMNALFVKDLAAKTHRGLEGRIRQGFSAGGLSYGYSIVREYDSNGEPVRGKRKVDDTQAEIVRHIFQEFCNGKSSRKIAKALNEQGVPGPREKQWNDSAIHGNRRRGTGILNCELYIGRLVWNRQRFIKEPISGKRQARLNPANEWITEDVPDLRIVDDQLWAQAKARQDRFSIGDRESYTGANLNRRHRKQYLLSGLIKCNSCGSNYIIVGKDTYGCSTRRTKGTCTNDIRMHRHHIETKVLDALKERLTDPTLVGHFIEEFNSEVARINSTSSDHRRTIEKKAREIDKKLTAIVNAIEQGVVTETTKDRLLELESEKAELAKKLSAPAPLPYPSLHPNLVELYKRKVERLEEALNDPEVRNQASEIIRTIVDRIEVTPNDDPDPSISADSERHDVKIVLYGQLAAVMALAEEKEAIENKERLSCVAGGRSHLYRTILII